MMSTIDWNSPDIVLLDSIRKEGEDNRTYLFTHPIMVLEVYTAQDVSVFFSRLQHALEQGYYAAGWFSYEFGYLLHPSLSHLLEERTPNVPLVWMGIFPRPRRLDEKARVKLARRKTLENMHLHLNISKKQFMDSIREIHEYIKKGDTYQVNFTIKALFEFSQINANNPFDLYCNLRNRQSVNYGAFIRAAQVEILCLSPELFFKKHGQKIWSMPMKGTIHRGSDEAEDHRLYRELQNDEKNRAENVMIVDLIRNDLGRICHIGSVNVPGLFTVERYETLFQMISRVEGRVKRDFSWPSCLRALFPCGSITGAPKLKTMEIIAGLERAPRGVYTGAIGFISPEQDACFNVAIRTIVLKDGIGELGIGAGITIYSDPEKEFEETLLKAGFFTKDITYEP